MIEVKDLRIGNIVTDSFYEHFKNVIKVESINDKGINLTIEDDGNYPECATHFMEPEYTFEKLYGIPLTPEILKKAGFKKKINKMQVDGIEMTLHLRGEEIPYGTWFSSCGTFNGGIAALCLCRGNYFAANIHFLHDLQNMHYVITGEELTLK